MPIYRFTRFIQTDAVEVEADSPEQAEALIMKGGIEVKGDFSHTRIEEVATKFSGYVEETTRDMLGEIKRA